MSDDLIPCHARNISLSYTMLVCILFTHMYHCLLPFANIETRLLLTFKLQVPSIWTGFGLVKPSAATVLTITSIRISFYLFCLSNSWNRFSMSKLFFFKIADVIPWTTPHLDWICFHRCVSLGGTLRMLLASCQTPSSHGLFRQQKWCVRYCLVINIWLGMPE